MKIKKIGKIVAFVLLGFVLLFFSLKMAIKSPKVQTWAINLVGSYLSSELDCKVSVGAVNIQFFKTIQLDNVYFADQKKDTVIFTPELNVTFSAFSVLKQQIIISEVELNCKNRFSSIC